MLVLTRKLGEKIRIGDEIIITVVELDSRHAKLGIDAPRAVIVHREEVYQRIQEENKAAAGVEKIDLQNIAKIWKEKKNPA